MPSVPSSTCTTARSRSASRTSPCRVCRSPSGSPRTRPSPRRRRRARPGADRAAPRSRCTPAAPSWSCRHPVLARPGDSPSRPAEHVLRPGGHVVRRRGFLPGPQDRGEVLVLDRRRGDPGAGQLAGSARRPAGPRRPARRPGSAPQLASTGLSALCCSRPSRMSRPATSVTRSRGRQGGGAHQLGQRADPVGLGEQRGQPGSGAPPSRRHPRRRARRRPSRRPGRTTRTRRRPGSGGRRRGRGPASTGRGRSAACRR